MRFLGKHVNSNGHLHQDFSVEVVSDFKRRAERVRINHSVAFYLGPTGESAFGSCSGQPSSYSLAYSDTLLFRDRGEQRNDNISERTQPVSLSNRRGLEHNLRELP